MKKIVFILVFLISSFTLSSFAAETAPNTNSKKPLTEQMIKKRNATVTFMESNYKNAMSNLEKTYKAVIEAKKNPKNFTSPDVKLSIDKINKIYNFYKDQINKAYEDDKRYIIQYYGE